MRHGMERNGNTALGRQKQTNKEDKIGDTKAMPSGSEISEHRLTDRNMRSYQ